MKTKDLESLGFKKVQYSIGGKDVKIYRLYLKDSMLDIKHHKDLEITHRVCTPPLVSNFNDCDITDLKHIINSLKTGLK